MGSHKIDVGLGNSAHADLKYASSYTRVGDNEVDGYLVEGSGEECGEGRREGYRAVSASSSNCYTDQVLFGDEAFDVSGGIYGLHLFGECGILHVSVKSNDAWVVLCNLNQGVAVSFPCGDVLA